MLHNPVVGRVCAVADENHAHIRHPWWPDGARAVRYDKNFELQTSRDAVGLLTHWARITVDVNVSQIFGQFVLGVSLPLSHSPSFDQRFRALAPLIAIASAFRCPTSTTSRLPRVTPV